MGDTLQHVHTFRYTIDTTLRSQVVLVNLCTVNVEAIRLQYNSHERTNPGDDADHIPVPLVQNLNGCASLDGSRGRMCYVFIMSIVIYATIR